jgi:23S rRNA pseudouridine1911/1915/1917 synthase
MASRESSARQEPKDIDGSGEAGERFTLAGGKSLIARGGKVDAEALRRAIEEARESAAESGAESDEEQLRRVVIDVRSDISKRLDKYLTDRITFMSRSQLQRLIDDGGVAVNGRPPKASTVIKRGDRIEVAVPEPPAKDIVPEDIPLDVLFEDEHIIVLNKQPDIIVHPARTHLKGTMLSALAYHFRYRSKFGGGLSSVGEEFARPGVVHRLDRHTSGVIVFAKSEEAHWKLGHQFEHRRVDKRYLAVVQGIVEPQAEVIELPIGPHPSREKGYREKYVVRHDELGKPSVTICRVREWFGKRDKGVGAATNQVVASPGWAGVDEPRPVVPAREEGTFTLVELELKTGRTHQIRVHLSHNDYPIVGDDMYGGRAYEHEGKVVIGRQALHAALLTITHPISGERMTFTAPLRGDMAELVTRLRALPGHEVAMTPGVSVDLEYAIG